jgi:hypothetical protein
MPYASNHIASQLRRRLIASVLTLTATIVLTPLPARAQSRAGSDSTMPRMRRYEHNIMYGVALGFVWAGVDQLTDEPSEWGKGWPGYGKRLASGVGEFVIQETVTDIGAALLHRPLTYPHCTCRSTANRVGWALKLAVMDQTRSGHLSPAYPRIVGAYAGSFAQASWLPASSTSRTETALVNGTISLAIGAGINVYYEFLKKQKKGPVYAAGP